MNASTITSQGLTWVVRAVVLSCVAILGIGFFYAGWETKPVDQESENATEGNSPEISASNSPNQLEVGDGRLSLYLDPNSVPSLGSGSANGASGRSRRQDDDVSSGLRSPLLAGISQLVDQVADTVGREELDLGSVISEADRELARIQRQNSESLRDVSRQYRRVSTSDKHLILITVDGLHNSEIESIPDRFHVLKTVVNHSLRFTQFHTHCDSELAWASFHLATNDVENSRPSVSAMRLIHQAGYTTALIGDCSHAPFFQGDDDEHYDFRFGVEPNDFRFNDSIESVWSNGTEMKLISSNTRTPERVQGLCIREATQFIQRERFGRPFFLHLAIQEDLELDPSMLVDDAGMEALSQAKMERMDRRLEAILRALHEAELERKAVIIVAGVGTDSSPEPAVDSYGVPESNAAATTVPLFYYWPKRTTGGRTSDVPCGVSDLLVTIADWADSTRRVRGPATSIAPSRLEQVAKSTRTLIWQDREQHTVVCQSPWKLIVKEPPYLSQVVFEDSKGENEPRDDREAPTGIGENHADQQPEIVDRLTRLANQ